MKLKFSKSPVNRFGWADAARGFVVFYMIITLITPGDWFKGSPILEFFFHHPTRVPGAWHLIDVGAPAFVLMLGLLLGVTFQKRKERDGTTKAVLHILARYALIFGLGAVLIFATYEDGFIYETKDDWLAYTNPGLGDQQITVIASDVIFLLGFVGFVALPFLFLKKEIRIFAGYGLVVIFQVLCLLNDYTKVINVTISSVHSGIYGAIFGYGAITVIGSSLGEFLFFTPDEKKKPLYRNLLILGAANVAFGFLTLNGELTFYPALMYIAMGITILGLLLFIFLDTRLHLKMHLLRGYGENTFLIYVITVIPWEILKLIVDEFLGGVPDAFEWGFFSAMLIFGLLLNGLILLLHFKQKKVKTETIALFTIFVVIILAIILISAGLL